MHVRNKKIKRFLFLVLFVAPIQHFCQKHLVNVKKYVENVVSIAIDGCQYRWRPLTPQKLIGVKNYSF